MKSNIARLLLAAGAVSLAGCASMQREQVWDGSGNFSIDQGQCQAQAYGAPAMNSLQIALVYNSCMRGKGWQLIDKPR